MNEFLNFTVVGLVTGAAYAIAAAGLVVTYTTSGVFNIAQGAIGMVFAYLFWQLVVAWHWPILAAALLVVAVLAPMFGAVVEIGIMRRTRGEGLAITLVVTIALMVLLIFAADWAWGGQLKAAPSFFGDRGWHLTSKVFVSWHETLTIVMAAAVALFLRLLLFRTRLGMAMRAVVDNRDLAALNGARPAWLSTFSWALGASMAALAGILIAPILDNLSVLPLTFLVIYAYGAAVLGSMRSLPLTFVGALLLGLSYSYLVGYLPQNSFFSSTPIQGLRLSLPVVLLFVALMVMRHPTMEGGQVRTWRQSVDVSPLGRSVVAALLLVGAVATAVNFLSTGDTIAVGEGMVYAIIVLSLVPLAGWGGHVSLCQMTFAGLGAFAMARTQGGSLLGLLAAIALGGAVGAIVALPALRLRGLYLALATLAFAVAMDNMFFPTSVAFTFGGSIHVNRPSIFGEHFQSNGSFVVFVTVVFALLAVGLLALRRGPFGRRLLAMKDSEAACATLGMSLTRTKLVVFTLSAAIAALGGALLGAMNTQAGTVDFSAQQSLPILLLAVVGGMATTSGALVSGMSFALVATKLQALVPSIPNLALGLTGMAAIGVAYNPEGTVPTTVRTVRNALGRFGMGGPVPAPGSGTRPVAGAAAAAAATPAPTR